jgi:hypothetical protein
VYAYLTKVAVVIFWSAVKYLLGFFMAVGFGFSFMETMLYNVGGGMIGVVFYLYLWDFLFHLRMKYFPPKPITGIKMSKTRRFLVRVIKKYELMGIVILTPVLLTPPVGTIISITLERNKWKIKRMMLISFTLWTLGLYAVYTFFGIRLDEVFTKIF